MARNLVAALRVADLAASIAFYTEQLGFTLGDQHAENTSVEIFNPLHPEGNAFLLAGPRAEDVLPYLSGPRLVLKPGQSIRFLREDLEAWRATLAEHGLTDTEIVENVWERTLILPDPDGYIINFAMLKQLTPAETLERYASGPDELEAALPSVAGPDLELRSAPDEWTIRQMVHHIADGDDLWNMALKAALANPGFHYSQEWYSIRSLAS